VLDVRGVKEPDPGTSRRGWPQVVALLAVTLVVSVFQPSVLIAVAFLTLALVFGVRRLAVVAAAGLAALIVAGGARDGIWYVERGWAVLSAGCFAALTLVRPGATFSHRALRAVSAAGLVAALVLGARRDAWGAVDSAVRYRMSEGVAMAMEAVRLLRGDQALPQALVTAIYETVEAQALVFPALVGVATMAALGVAWWVYVRLSAGSDQGLGPLREFRFSDHLVWVFIGGLVLVLGRWGDAVARVGANAVVFMGALYGLRGAAVIVFLSGGLSLFGYVLLVFGLIFVPPVVVAGAMVIGIGDTWLDVRSKSGSLAA
jgi:hypothetical protein